MLFSLVILSGCASYPKIIETWPEELPPVAHFIASYEIDTDNKQVQSIQDYLIWVKRFYQGWVVYDNAWLVISADLERRMDVPEKRAEAARQIAAMGLRIAPEWAKEKEDRYIHTNAVVVWGEALLEALNRDQVFAYMVEVNMDIDQLEQGLLAEDQITIEHYFPDLIDADFSF